MRDDAKGGERRAGDARERRRRPGRVAVGEARETFVRFPCSIVSSTRRTVVHASRCLRGMRCLRRLRRLVVRRSIIADSRAARLERHLASFFQGRGVVGVLARQVRPAVAPVTSDPELSAGLGPERARVVVALALPVDGRAPRAEPAALVPARTRERENARTRERESRKRWSSRGVAKRVLKTTSRRHSTGSFEITNEKSLAARAREHGASRARTGGRRRCIGAWARWCPRAPSPCATRAFPGGKRGREGGGSWSEELAGVGESDDRWGIGAAGAVAVRRRIRARNLPRRDTRCCRTWAPCYGVERAEANVEGRSGKLRPRKVV